MTGSGGLDAPSLASAQGRAAPGAGDHSQEWPAREPAEAGRERAAAFCSMWLRSPMTNLSWCWETSILL